MLEMLWKFAFRQFERWTFVVKFGGLLWKKNYIETSHEDEPLRKNLKHQVKVDNNSGWLVFCAFPLFYKESFVR